MLKIPVDEKYEQQRFLKYMHKMTYKLEIWLIEGKPHEVSFPLDRRQASISCNSLLRGTVVGAIFRASLDS